MWLLDNNNYLEKNYHSDSAWSIFIILHDRIKYIFKQKMSYSTITKKCTILNCEKRNK